MNARHVVQQGPVVGALGRMALQILRQRLLPPVDGAPPLVPGPPLTAVVPPRDPALVRDYIRWCRGDPAAWRGTLPPHLFPQWGFPLLARTAADLPYPLARILNGGCRLEIAAPLPAAEPLHLSARLEDIDDDGRRVVLHQRLATGTADRPECLVAHVYAVIPLSRPDGGPGHHRPSPDGGPGHHRPHPDGAGHAQHRADGGRATAGPDGERPAARADAPGHHVHAHRAGAARAAPPLVPADAREIGQLRLGPRAGWEFAWLTGDFNPVHWLPAYGRAAGFGGVILHGFATLARAVERLNRVVLAGDVRALRTVDVRFTRPLRLPARVAVLVRRGELYVGAAPGAPAHLQGRYETR